ncbi:MAG: carotenoid 1,2-hydratase [Comamonadaceae bacterium CG1_02_60_18]|nr:MAG: carotenoid 1,2-hydratase [Comamonadaceae bacterium CG1_02_60_18]OIP14793.1 MAG: carotenoid 1,2-hydratase [Comamonadaceae bacterium CG2_30_59_20]
MLSRRAVLLGMGGGALGWQPLFVRAQQPDLAPPPLIQRALQFPRDHGSHPNTALEWWYVTGALQAPQRPLGFQLTFFRSRVPSTQGMRSAFAAKQLIFAHAAVTDVAGKRLWHDQRIARSSGNEAGSDGVDLAHASEADIALRLRDWSLQRQDGRYLAEVRTPDFSLQLTLKPTQPLLLQGDQGWSRKGPLATQASFYYSLPQLQVDGTVGVGRQRLPVQGRAWLDHEWSNAFMPPEAVGWDWIGMNLHDGSALTAFRLRSANGQAVWAGGSWRDAPGHAPAQVLRPEEVSFQPLRHWKSPATGASYPVEWLVTAGARRFTVRAVIDAQELDSSRSTGAVYWEGLSDLLDDSGQVLGRGYLELTGYAKPLRLS